MQWSDYWEIIVETLSNAWEWITEHFVELFAAMLIFAVVMFIACMIFGAMTNEQNRIDSGVIVDKQYTAERWLHNHSRRPVYEPAYYAFTICGEKNGELVEYTFEVDAETYGAYRIGEEYHR